MNTMQRYTLGTIEAFVLIMLCHGMDLLLREYTFFECFLIISVLYVLVSRPRKFED